MEIDITRIPRVARLLGRIEETRRRAADLPEGHAGRDELEARAGVLYGEVGRYVHWLVRQDPDAIERVCAEGVRWAEAIDQELGLQPLPDVLDVPVLDLPEDDLMEASVAPSLELTADSRVGAVDVRALPRPAREVAPALPQVAARRRVPTPVPSLDPGQLEPMGLADDREEPTDPTGDAPQPSGDAARPEARSAPWSRSLEDLLAAIGESVPVPADADRRVAQVRAVVNATGNLEVRWAVFPKSVQQALVGLVGARARRLQVALGEDPDLKLSVGRLRRFAEQRELVLVPSLRAGPPAARDWESDERRYADVLRAGL